MNNSLDVDISSEELPELEIDAENYETYVLANALFAAREYARYDRRTASPYVFLIQLTYLRIV